MITTKEKLLIFMVILIAIIFTIFTVIKRESQEEKNSKYKMTSRQHNGIWYYEFNNHTIKTEPNMMGSCQNRGADK